MTDQDVIDLYRCMLGRAPENADTIRAFKHYYPDFAAGRRAILESDEFKLFAAQVTGQTREAAAAPLALALLTDLSPPPVPPSDPALRSGFDLQIAKLPQARVALVVGDITDHPLDDFASLGGAEAVVLHIAAAPRPHAGGTLADGTVRLSGPWSPLTLCALLEKHGEKIDLLVLLGPPSDQAWMEALLPILAPRLLVAIRDSDAFDAAAISSFFSDRRPGEPPLHWRGFILHHIGAWLLPVTYTPRRVTPPPSPRPTLAIAAIVRDEAACVINMLRSARPFADFLAVLDTGSADGTPGLVRDFLSASERPFVFAEIHHESFESRFADMRNAALDMVPDWVEWVLMLDADEEIAPEDAEPLFTLITAGEFDAYALPRYNYRGADKSGEVTTYPDRQVRLLRHGAGPRPRYSGAVHETVRGIPVGQPKLDASAIGGSAGGPHIHHLVRRFRDAEAEEKKQEFYRQIARRHERDPAEC